MFRYFKRLLSRYEDTRILDNLLPRTAQGEDQDETDPDLHEGGNVPGGHDGEGPSGSHGGESSRGGVETMHAEGGGDTQRTTNATSQE